MHCGNINLLFGQSLAHTQGKETKQNGMFATLLLPTHDGVLLQLVFASIGSWHDVKLFALRAGLCSIITL